MQKAEAARAAAQKAAAAQRAEALLQAEEQRRAEAAVKAAARRAETARAEEAVASMCSVSSLFCSAFACTLPPVLDCGSATATSEAQAAFACIVCRVTERAVFIPAQGARELPQELP